MYDSQVEKLKLFNLLGDSFDEYKTHKKKQRLKTSINLVDEELDKIDAAFRDFEKTCNELIIFDEVFGSIYGESFHNAIKQIRSLFHDHKSKDEVKNLPSTLYYHHIEVEKKKLEILNKIAKKYNK